MPTPVCGNGVIEPPEECDDLDTTPGDGCGATCLVEYPDDCPGTPIDLAPGIFVITDTTSGANDTVQDAQGVGICGNGTYSGADLIYAVTPIVSGTLEATSDTSFGSHFATIRTACPGGTVLACDYGTTSLSNDDLQVDVVAGTTYYVVVDSWGNTAGAFTLTLTLTAI